MAAKQPEAAVQQNPPVASAEDANHEKLADLKEDQDEDPAPDGGARAWLAAAGGGAIFFSTLGFANSFGTFEEFYVSQQLRGNSPSKIAWIGSLSIALQFMVGIIAGPLFDRFGSKVCPSRVLVNESGNPSHASWHFII